MSAELARKFHDAYERLAPSFGYETRKDTRAFDPESPNGKLMIAVCAEIVADLTQHLELIGGPFDGGSLPASPGRRVMLISFDEGRASEATPCVYEQANGRYEFRHHATAAAQEGYSEKDGE